MLGNAALYLSFIMAVYLFVFSYIEGIKIANSDEKVHGGTFIFTFTFAFIFSGLTYIL
ncbi:hypothetical protein WMO40_10245 [Bacillaceae bacterium CLA-AA-H227]|uniref:Uncharacterized protein n=1 Tax=Robertmurraya yapensis (ex Hitch et al 2024) TaxID=3133160 RepID=A0ACC6SAG8_9BACI|nr:hypothetical protein [Bacillus yapensis]